MCIFYIRVYICMSIPILCEQSLYCCFSDHSNSVSSCTFTKTGSHLATTSWDKTIRIYDVAIGTYRTRGPVVLQHDGCVSCSCFSSDGTIRPMDYFHSYIFSTFFI